MSDRGLRRDIQKTLKTTTDPRDRCLLEGMLLAMAPCKCGHDRLSHAVVGKSCAGGCLIHGCRCDQFTEATRAR